MFSNLMNKVADFFEHSFLGKHSDLFKYYALSLRKWKDFKGRAGVQEFWLLQPVIMVCSILLSIFIQLVTMLPGGILVSIFYFIGQVSRIPAFTTLAALIGVLAGIASIILSILFWLPGISLLFRRLHDAGHSAAVLLWMCCPLVFPIIIWWFTIQDSDEGDNKYGPMPTDGFKSGIKVVSHHNEDVDETPEEETFDL